MKRMHFILLGMLSLSILLSFLYFLPESSASVQPKKELTCPSKLEYECIDKVFYKDKTCKDIESKPRSCKYVHEICKEMESTTYVCKPKQKCADANKDVKNSYSCIDVSIHSNPPKPTTPTAWLYPKDKIPVPPPQSYVPNPSDALPVTGAFMDANIKCKVSCDEIVKLIVIY